MSPARARLLLAALAAAFVALPATAAAADLDFGTVRPGVGVAHQFVLRNDSQAEARISAVRLSPPLKLERTPAVVPAGGTVALRVHLDTTRLRGAYRGQLVVALENAPERVFEIAGRVEPSVDVLPRPAVFISTPRGKAASASIEIVQHDAAPLAVSIAARPSEGEARLDPVEPGRRYRLTFALAADAPPGRRRDRVELATSSPDHPSIPITVNLLVRERVHTFPDVVDLGSMRLREMRAAGAGANALSQTLMVYQHEGHDFRVEPSTALPALDVHAERGPHGDRVQLTVSIDPRKVTAGRLEGTLVLATNDPEFPRLEIPVRGVVLPD